MDTSKTLIGYRVRTASGWCIDTDGAIVSRTKPMKLADAYHALGKYLDLYNGPDPRIVKVFKKPSPIQGAAHELGTLLSSLCQRHGLDLGMTQEQIDRQIARELSELGASKR